MESNRCPDFSGHPRQWYVGADTIFQTLTMDRLKTMIAELCGGSDVVEMLDEAKAGASERQIAEWHKLPKATVHEVLTRARVRLRRAGVMPTEWEPKRHILSAPESAPG